MRRESLVQKQLDSLINGLATGLLADSVGQNESVNQKKKKKKITYLFRCEICGADAFLRYIQRDWSATAETLWPRFRPQPCLVGMSWVKSVVVSTNVNCLFVNWSIALYLLFHLPFKSAGKMTRKGILLCAVHYNSCRGIQVTTFCVQIYF